MHGKLWKWIPLNEFYGADKTAKASEEERTEEEESVCCSFSNKNQTWVLDRLFYFIRDFGLFEWQGEILPSLILWISKCRHY